MTNTLQNLKTLRTAIRYHRDQKGDDRCWLDDNGLWALLDEKEPELKTPPPFEEMMARCRDFYVYRRSDVADAVPKDAIMNPAMWDADLDAMSESQVQAELARTRHAVMTHRDIVGRPLTLEDDRALYLILPEKIPADFRLPPENEFLGETKKNAGCPAFWKSHQACPCQAHDLHKWGPCC